MEYADLFIEVRESRETGDFQTRFVADTVDLIDRFWSDMIGLDPDMALAEPTPLLPADEPHVAIVARCNCGEVSCGSIDVRISRDGGRVIWKEVYGGRSLSFDETRYKEAVARVIADTDWETPDRTAARLLRPKIDHDKLAARRLTYRWSSGCLRTGNFTMTFASASGHQVFIHIQWRDLTPDKMAERCAIVLAQDPTEWEDVEWSPWTRGLPSPPLAGPNWRERGSG